MTMKQTNAYKNLFKSYDDAITGRRWWSWMYMRGIWRVNYNKIAEEVLSLIPNDMAGRLLDIPIGSLIFTMGKYERMTSCEIFGVDYSSEMIELSKAQCQGKRLYHLHLIQGDVLNLKFEDSYFDSIITMNGLQSFPNKDFAFAEMYRVLKPGGLMCGSLYIKGHNTLADWIAHHPLERKGVFIAPHYTMESAQNKLIEFFGESWVAKRHGSILIFRAIKRQ